MGNKLGVHVGDNHHHVGYHVQTVNKFEVNSDVSVNILAVNLLVIILFIYNSAYFFLKNGY